MVFIFNNTIIGIALARPVTRTVKSARCLCCPKADKYRSAEGIRGLFQGITEEGDRHWR